MLCVIVLNAVILNVVMLSAAMMIETILKVARLNAVMLSVSMPSVVAPSKDRKKFVELFCERQTTKFFEDMLRPRKRASCFKY